MGIMMSAYAVAVGIWLYLWSDAEVVASSFGEFAWN